MESFALFACDPSLLVDKSPEADSAFGSETHPVTFLCRLSVNVNYFSFYHCCLHLVDTKVVVPVNVRLRTNTRGVQKGSGTII